MKALVLDLYRYNDITIESRKLSYPHLAMTETPQEHEGTKLESLLAGCSLLFMVGLPLLGFALLFLVFLSVYLVLLLSPFFINHYAEYIIFFQKHPVYSILIFAVLGLALFQLRTHLLVAFALIEITGGLALAWNIFHSTYSSGVLFWTAFMGAIYLLIRGFDNGWKGYKEFRKAKDELIVGHSTVSFSDAVKHAVLSVVTRDIKEYEEAPSSYKIASHYSISESNVYIDNPVVYEVLVKIKRRRVAQTDQIAIGYEQLEPAELFSTYEYFPFTKNVDIEIPQIGIK